MKKFLIGITAGALAFSLAQTPAVAGDVGFGIGFGIPYGGERAGYSRMENYAAFSFEKIIEELTVTEKGGRLEIELKITNDSDEDYSLNHKDGQEYEMAILDKNGAVLWRSSDGMAFTQAFTSTLYPHRESVVYTVKIERKEYRRLKDKGVLLTAFLTDTPYRLSLRLPHINHSSDGARHGTIFVGGGTW